MFDLTHYVTFYVDANQTIPVTGKPTPPIPVPTISEWGRILLVIAFLAIAANLLHTRRQRYVKP